MLLRVESRPLPLLNQEVAIRPDGNAFERFARRTTALAERWMPDAFVFALAATLVSVVAAFAVDPALRSTPLRVVDVWGEGFWTLIPFTLQMAMIIIGGYVLATAPPVFRVIAWFAAKPRSAKGAVLLVALVAMGSSLINWGFSLIASAILAREVARRVPAADYRALGASAFLGLGTVWAQGLSGSAALQMARVSSMPAEAGRDRRRRHPAHPDHLPVAEPGGGGDRNPGGGLRRVALRSGRWARPIGCGPRDLARPLDTADVAGADRPRRAR